MEDLTGKRLGKYQIGQEIGRGGMGAVYRAYDLSLQRDVALKVLPPHLAWDPAFVERFTREARAAARLSHPNIVAVYDIGREGQVHYFAMQYLPGENVKTMVERRGQMPQASVLSILHQIAGALDYAHAQGLVHRDIKPSNIIVSPEGRAVLTDFGIAKAVDESKLTATGMTLGTPEYMSPEQAAGSPAGPPADRYSLAVVAYELLAGQVPFQADSVMALLYRIVHEAPPPLRGHRPNLPPQVDAVMARALAKDPSARYPSGQSFVQDLERALAGQAVEAQAPAAVQATVAAMPPAAGLPVAGPAVAGPPIAGPTAYVPAPPAKKFPWALLAVAGLTIVAVIVVVVVLTSRPSPGVSSGPSGQIGQAYPTDQPLPTAPPTIATLPPVVPPTVPPQRPTTAVPLPTPTPTPDVKAEIYAALWEYTRVRAEAERTLNSSLLQQVCVDPYLTVKTQRVEANKRDGSHWETSSVDFTITSLTTVSADKVEVMVHKTETKLFFPRGSSRPDDEICGGSIWSYRNCTYDVLYTLVRLGGKWYVSDAKDFGDCVEKCQH